MQRKRFLRTFCLILGGLAVTLVFQNCKVQPIQSNVDASSFDSSADQQRLQLFSETLKKLEMNLDPNCMSSSKYNACIFWKNPVAQSGRALASSLTGSSNLEGLQIHGVQVDGYDNSGFLRNSDFSVSAMNDSSSLHSISTNSGSFKFRYGNDPNHRLSQVMAYYWLNVQKDFMQSQTGSFFAQNRRINVISYVPNVDNAFWDGEDEVMIIGSTESGGEYALFAEVYAHEMGHANSSYATNNRIFEDVSAAGAKSIPCGNDDEAVCCQDIKGCSWAIDEGLADYHFAMLFPEKTEMLESLVNSSSGFSECGVTRTVERNANLTSSQSYNACASPYRGQVHVMGRVYASIWWEIRKAAEQQNPGQGARDIDTLFTNHLPTLNGQDDFSTTRAKIIATEAALLDGRYSQIVRNEFSQRGIF